MADGLDIVAVRVTDEGTVVAGVVFGPDAGRMQYLGADRGRLSEKPVDGLPADRAERDVRLAEAITGRLRPDPELGGGRDAVPDDVSEVHDPSAAERGQHGVVENLAGGHVRALYGEMIDHTRAPICR